MSYSPAGAFNGTHLSALGTTTLKSGPGVLHRLVINSKGASGNTVTLYDSTSGSGTVLAVVDATQNVVSLAYDVNFITGLTAVVAAGTAADITISWL